MPPAAPQVFPDITPDHFAALSEKANAAGIGLTGNSGTASRFGVEVSWDYSPDARQLTIQCLKSPVFASPETVYAKIKAMIQETVIS